MNVKATGESQFMRIMDLREHTGLERYINASESTCCVESNLMAKVII